jgi:hypothetical protein
MRTFAQAAAAKEMAEAVVGGIRHLTDVVLNLGIFRAALPLTPFFSFPLFLRFFFLVRLLFHNQQKSYENQQRCSFIKVLPFRKLPRAFINSR